MRWFRVGVQLCQEHTTIDALREAWMAADQLGVDSIWVWDHFFPLTAGSGAHFESWMLLAAMAIDTERASLGVLVSAAGYRNPDLLADMARTADHLSGGRVVLGIGAGWSGRDHGQYGYPLGTRATRSRGLESALIRIKGRLAMLDPPPVGDLPILVGGGGENVTLRLAAQHAQIWNVSAPPDRFAAKNRRLDLWCETVGRDPGEIERTVLLPGPAALADLADYLRAGARHIVLAVKDPFNLDDLALLVKASYGMTRK